MTITLYINYSDSIEVNKNIEYVKELTGIFRNATSLTEPIIEIESSHLIEQDYLVSYDDNGDSFDLEVEDDGISLDVGIVNPIDIYKVNYLYIHELERYYYVKDIILYNTALFDFICKEDTLMSLKDEFLELKALVSRNQFTYDNEIEDEKMAYKFLQQVDEYTITTGNDFNFNTTLDPASLNYYISVLEDNAPYEGNATTSPVSDLPSISFGVTGLNKFASNYVTNVTNVNELADRIINHEEYGTFLKSLIVYPFSISSVGEGDYLTLGNTLIAGVLVWDLKNTQSEYFKVAAFYINTYAGFNRGYLEKEPYSIYELYLPYYGYIELKSSDIVDSLIEVYYSFDFTNGTAKINVYNKTKEYTIKSVTATVGIKISINRTNNQQLSDEKTQLAIKSAISTAASIASIGVGAYTSNPFLISQGVSGLSSTAIDIATKLNMMHEKAQTANNTGYEGLYGCQKVKLKVTKYVKKEPYNYSLYYGKPLNQEVKLNTLLGYTVIKDIHLENIDALDSEKEDLMSLLTSGIIL